MAGLRDRLPFLRRLRRAPRILILDDYRPDRAIGAGVPRTIEMLRSLSAAGAEVTIGPLAGPMASGYRVEPHGAAIVTGTGVERLRHFLVRRANSFDGIIVSRPHNMRAFLDAVGQAPPISGLPPLLYDAEALYAERDIAMHAVMGVPLAEDVARQMLDDEVRLAASAEVILTVNQHAANVFLSAGHRDVRIVGYSIDPRPTSTPYQDRKGFLFVGPTRVESEPNSDSVVWFADHVLPLLRARLGHNASLVVVGMTGAQTVMARASAGLCMRGHCRTSLASIRRHAFSWRRPALPLAFH